ncbi:lipid kinase [Neosynechococcus sphagnicola sy1]|uniref:Methylglyoxal synthase n=1 Tax=Neosynechococcus sphagnicola sy1 TaxID=1497020 RepID=A0A098TM59_9CYAN|nr:methylglyoxal synthase [Neosynechococcus sphagnicola]KGF73394.1 lipid kinase [Neosynechococcus sphagnicola sy1]
MPATIALIAHDSRKEEIVNFAKQHLPLLKRYRLIATRNTGERIQAATGLPVVKMLSGALGGDGQILAEVVSGKVTAVIFLVDVLKAQTHEPELRGFLRVCNIHNIPLATNLATAEMIAVGLTQKQVAHLIFNPVAGQGIAEQELALIQQLLEPHLNLQIHLTTPEINPVRFVQQAIDSHADIIIAAGGDGTVSAVAGALIGTGIPLGIIPRGTANAFSVALGLPTLMPIRSACQVILAGQTRTVDAAQCNGLPMVLLAGIGYEAETIERANRELKNQWGMMAYLMAGWQMMNEQQVFNAEIAVEGQIHYVQAMAITIANAAPPTSVLAQGGGAVIFDDGLLDVTITTVESKLHAVTTLLSMFSAALVKTSPEHPNVFHGRTKALQVTTTPPQKVVVDGEIIGTTPITVECIPGGLMILTPSL